MCKFAINTSTNMFHKHRKQKQDKRSSPLTTQPRSLSTPLHQNCHLPPAPDTTPSQSLPPPGSTLFSPKTPALTFTPQEVWDHIPLKSLSFRLMTLHQVFHNPAMLAELTLSDPTWVGNFMAG